MINVAYGRIMYYIQQTLLSHKCVQYQGSGNETSIDINWSRKPTNDWPEKLEKLLINMKTKSCDVAVHEHPTTQVAAHQVGKFMIWEAF